MHEFIVLGKKRYVPHLTDEVEAISQLSNQDIYRAGTMYLCADAAVNFLCSLIEPTVRTNIITLGEQNDLGLRQNAITPIIQDEGTKTVYLANHETIDITGHFVRKNLFGKPGELVTTGPYAGLLLSTQDEKSDRIFVQRLWNDRVCIPGEYGYNQTQFFASKVRGAWNSRNSEIEYFSAERKRNEIEQRATDEVIQQLEMLLQQFSFYSEVLLYLCGILNIPIDESLFHRSFGESEYQKWVNNVSK